MSCICFRSSSSTTVQKYSSSSSAPKHQSMELTSSLPGSDSGEDDRYIDAYNDLCDESLKLDRTTLYSQFLSYSLRRVYMDEQREIENIKGTISTTVTNSITVTKNIASEVTSAAEAQKEKISQIIFEYIGDFHKLPGVPKKRISRMKQMFLEPIKHELKGIPISNNPFLTMCMKGLSEVFYLENVSSDAFLKAWKLINAKIFIIFATSIMNLRSLITIDATQLDPINKTLLSEFNNKTDELIKKKNIRLVGPFPTLPLEFFSLTEITNLSLRDCQIEFIPSQIFTLSSLKSIDLENNRLTNLPELNLPELAYINLKNNPLQSLPLCLLNLPKLQVIEVDNTCFIPPEFNDKITKGLKIEFYLPPLIIAGQENVSQLSPSPNI